MGYLLKVAVDVGSTNSQVAARLIDEKTGKDVLCGGDLKKCLLTEESKPDIRTLILKKQDVQGAEWDNIVWDSEIYCGRKALDTVSRHVQGYDKLISGFKQKLYWSQQERSDPKKEAEYQKACQDMTIFLRYLRELVEEHYRIYQDQIVKRVTYVTVPNRSGSVEQETMQQLKKKAGWENVEIRLEAQQALRYALARQGSPIMKAIENIRVFDRLYILLADIGGSTADMLLIKVQPDGNGGYTTDTLGWWPERGEKNTLGGADVDKAICEYLLQQEYLVPQAVSELVAAAGYESFRCFKEFYTPSLRKGKYIKDLQEIGHFQQYPPYARRPKDWPKVEYEDMPENQKINREIYLNNIAKGYLTQLRDAVRSLLQSCRDGEKSIGEKDIDFVLATGGGCNMLGIEELFCGSFPQEDPLEFDKIKNCPEKYITEEPKYASAVCAMGCLADLRSIRCREHSNGTYTLTLQIYSGPANLTAGWDYKNGIPAIPSEFRPLKVHEMTLFQEGTMLPANYTIQKEYTVALSNQSNLVLIMTLRRTRNGNITVERQWSTYSARGPLYTLKAQFVNETKSFKLRYGFKAHMTEQQRITITPTCQVEGGGRWGLQETHQDVRQ